MPAVSKKQRKFFGMLMHKPGMAKKRGIHMTKEQMRDFASTKEKGLPSKIKKHLKKKGLTHNYS